VRVTQAGGSDRRTATVTVLFCDLVASTERHQLHGDDAADEFRREFFAALRAAADASSGNVVKNTGDGLMVVFRDSAVDAVSCATKMHENVEALDVDPPAYIRIGISAGEASTEHGDWFGTPVIEAARLCDAADTGQTLVNDVVRVLVGSRGGHQEQVFDDCVGAVERHCLAASGDLVVAGTTAGELLVSRNGGRSFARERSDLPPVRAVAIPAR
jgi:class 3 adenylate cyclase